MQPDSWLGKCHITMPGIPLLGQLSWRLFLVVIMDLKQRQVQKKNGTSLKDVYFLSHYPVTAGRLTGTVNPKSFPALQLATIYSFVALRLKFNLPGRLTSGSGHSCDPKDIGYHQGGTYPLCRLCEQTKQQVFWGNLVMQLLYKSETYLCSVAAWCRSQGGDNWGKNMKGIRRAQCIIPFHV